MKRAIMDVVAPAETVEDDEVSEEAEETNDPEYYVAEGEDGDAEDTEETDAVPASVNTAPVVDADAEETAYEQATGFKKD
jgi:hypothetical protein